MSSRYRLIITALVVCHLLLAPPLVTSQLHPSDPPPKSQDEIEIRAVEQEKDGTTYKLRGHSEIHYRSWVLYADEVTFDEATGQATAEGNVVLDGGPDDEHIQATRAEYNTRTEVGRFFGVVGSTGLQMKASKRSLVSPSPILFSGKLVEKNGPGRFVVHDGTITTCELPHPKWMFSASKVSVNVGGNAHIYQSVFRVRGVPVLYFPYATHPVKREPRESGFLIPNFGQSSRKGTVIGESFYLALGRSVDLQAGAEYFSTRGWAQHGSFRARPSPNSYIDLSFFGVLDRSGNDQGGQDARLSAESKFPLGFRGVADLEYLSRYVFRLAFEEVFSQVVNSEVKSTAFLSRNSQGFSYNAFVGRYQNFQTTAAGDVITILHAPSLEFSGVDHAIGNSPLFVSFNAAMEGLSRSEPSFRTANLVGRFDFHPSVAMPMHWNGWSVRPELALRDTLYTQELVANGGVGLVSSNPVNRKALETSVEVRPPAIERIFASEVFDRKLKHVIEPSVTYRYTAGVNNFASILRFDSRDILSNTNEVEFGLINRLYSKRVHPAQKGTSDCQVTEFQIPAIGTGTRSRSVRDPWQKSDNTTACPKEPEVREIVRWKIAGKYFVDPNFGGAVINGRRNMLTTTADLTGISFLTDARHLSPLISRLQIQTTAHSDAEWHLDYDLKKGRISSSAAIVNYHFGKVIVGGSDNYLLLPGEVVLSNPQPSPSSLHQFRILLGYAEPTKRGWSAATSFGFDANQGFLQYAAVQNTYNWDCCGVSVEYRRFALGSVRNENQFRFSFSLANVGAFGNMRRRERLF